VLVSVRDWPSPDGGEGTIFADESLPSSSNISSPHQTQQGRVATFGRGATRDAPKIEVSISRRSSMSNSRLRSASQTKLGKVKSVSEKVGQVGVGAGSGILK
jgi:hypothetical protein